jgi:hypothetical protein
MEQQSTVSILEYQVDYLQRKKQKLEYHLVSPPFNNSCISAACYQLQELLFRPIPPATVIKMSGLGTFLNRILVMGSDSMKPASGFKLKDFVKVQDLAKQVLDKWQIHMLQKGKDSENSLPTAEQQDDIVNRPFKEKSSECAQNCDCCPVASMAFDDLESLLEDPDILLLLEDENKSTDLVENNKKVLQPGLNHSLKKGNKPKRVQTAPTPSKSLQLFLPN